MSDPMFVRTSRLYILVCHNFVSLIFLLLSPGIINVLSLRWRLAVSRFYQFSDIDTLTLFNQNQSINRLAYADLRPSVRERAPHSLPKVMRS